MDTSHPPNNILGADLNKKNNKLNKLNDLVKYFTRSSGFVTE
jgi:hypothetical protein